MMTLDKSAVLYEDGEVLVCHKPAGTATQTAKLGEHDMVSLVRNYLRDSYAGVIHRLDQPVEGILVFARTKEAAACLNGREGERTGLEKAYYAVILMDKEKSLEICKQGSDEVHVMTDYIQKDSRDNTSKVVDKGTQAARRSRLEYRILKTLPVDEKWISALIRIKLDTGRHHQIRVQMSHAGMPLLGDQKYGTLETVRISREQNISHVALCAYSLSFLHPKTEEWMEYEIIPANPAFAPFLPVNT